MGNHCVLKGSQLRFVLNLQAHTQSKHGGHLYDHRDRTSDILKCDCQIKGNCIVVRTITGLDILTCLEDYQTLNKNKLVYMVDVKFGPESFIVGEHAFKYAENPLMCSVWQVVTQPMEVEIGDVFKLSSHIIRVVDICTKRKTNLQKIKKHIISNSSSVHCKICQNSDSTAQNPIMIPCKCQNSSTYIHIECLKKCIKESTAYNRSPTGLRITRDAMVCQFCKQEYPSEVFSENRSLADIDLEDKVDPPYIKLEVLASDDGDNNCTEMLIPDIIVESFAKSSQLKIGRKSDCHIKMGLEFLSRQHAMLTYDQENSRVLIEDLGSSFGTLRYIRGPNLLCFKNQELKLQFGNMLVSFKAGAIPAKNGPPKENHFPEVEEIIRDGQAYIHSQHSIKLVPEVTEFSIMTSSREALSPE